jgi:hypothetical protein
LEAGTRRRARLDGGDNQSTPVLRSRPGDTLDMTTSSEHDRRTFTGGHDDEPPVDCAVAKCSVRVIVPGLEPPVVPVQVSFTR